MLWLVDGIAGKVVDCKGALATLLVVSMILAVEDVLAIWLFCTFVDRVV